MLITLSTINGIFLMNKLMLAARYLILPFTVILLLGIVLLIIQAAGEIIYLFTHLATISNKDVLIGLFGIIDLALLANILLLISLSAYDSFVSRLNTSSEQVSGLDALDGLTLAKVKLKLLGSMLIISAIGLLSSFLSLGISDNGNLEGLYAQVAVHLVLAVSAVLLAYSDRLDKSDP